MDKRNHSLTLQESPPSPRRNREHSAKEDQQSVQVDTTDEPFILEEDSYDYPEENPETTLVGRAVAEALPSAWNTIHGVEVKTIDKTTYIFRFNHSLDLLNVLKESPWSVAGNLIILQRWTKDQNWNFSSFQIWVQIHGLPEEAMQLSVALITC
ncbi:hypothetical protein NE237_003874 [Protea cynaroides]|uniref:DUF4283 domain-containing protein n=1 Tax=Protea cynaroides TaxID=273540 RepID=A0A9Q0KHW8_9MAGN|nr:hypothetical protein NE237_003874 [Protea cynaroides]